MLPWLAPRTRAKAVDPGRAGGASLAKRVKDELLALILDGALAPGQRINEPDVAARLGISRVPVREALRELESTGLVVARRHAGVFVRVLADREVADLYELRALLDGHAGARAAGSPPAARQALLRVLADFQRRMERAAAADDVRRYYAANLAFHWAIVEAARNEALAASYRGVVQQLHLARLTNLKQGLAMQSSLAEHRAIALALAAGDAARAQALQIDHVHAARARLAAYLARHRPEEDAR